MKLRLKHLVNVILNLVILKVLHYFQRGFVDLQETLHISIEIRK